jgi:glutamine synthetase
MIRLEYIWLDGYKPEPNLRSKVKIIKEWNDEFTLEDCPLWSFDGSSTQQAEGNFSDRILQPVRIYPNALDGGYFVLCEVMNPNGSPHETNLRNSLPDDTDVWYGFEQEYTIMKLGRPLGFPTDGYPAPQGKYYCGVGMVYGRSFVEKHMRMCECAGLNIVGINAEVLLGQWEFQILGHGSKSSADDLWMARYLLYRLAEVKGWQIEFHPKPVSGDWNGSGLHTNFSNRYMREVGGESYFKKLFEVFESRHTIHIENYGSSNELRLTGKHETQSIDKFSCGVSDRGASLRVPLNTEKYWAGYVEDRRPASNADPYRIVSVISEALGIVDLQTQGQ